MFGLLQNVRLQVEFIPFSLVISGARMANRAEKNLTQTGLHVRKMIVDGKSQNYIFKIYKNFNSFIYTLLESLQAILHTLLRP